MEIQVGQKIPDVTLVQMGPEGPVEVPIADKLAGRKVVIFGLPGAFTPTCSAAHLPSFIRTKAAFDEKGVDEIICISVNDAHVMKVWGETSGATEAGITMLADVASEFTKAIGMEFSNPIVGFFDRCRRFSAYVEDGVVKVMNIEVARGACELSAGETLLEQI